MHKILEGRGMVLTNSKLILNRQSYYYFSVHIFNNHYLSNFLISSELKRKKKSTDVSG